MYTITLPFPPSVNNYWRTFRGRMIVSARGRAYRQAVAAACYQTGMPKQMTGRLAVTIDAYPPDRRRRDISNLEKAIGDSLEAVGVFADDEQIDDLRITRRDVEPPGRVVVTIKERA